MTEISQYKYINFKNNGRLFPSWILANFKKYKLPDIIKDKDDDPCSKKAKDELRSYQKFLSEFMDYNSPYNNILIYHGLGSGKTVSAINIYNMLYNYTSGWNVFILLKATLKKYPWIPYLEEWLINDEKKYRFDNVRFISYDAPNADKAFLDAVKNVDNSKKSLYIIDEVHNFIRNVYTNISTKQGKRAQTIYDYIIQDKKENDSVRVLLLSATPAINSPYELALIFNLLRPGSFPKNENQFNQTYVSSSGLETLNETRKNNFQRRILGLVSYYIGSTPDYFATKTIINVDIEMSEYHDNLYEYFENIEKKAENNMIGKQKQSTYKSYTRQACNFVFPPMAQGMSGETRPRPKNFKISEKTQGVLDKGLFNIKDKKHKEKYYNIQNYIDMINKFENTFDNYLYEKAENDKKIKYTIIDDIKKFSEIYKNNYNNFIKNELKKSSLLEAMYSCSSKMLHIILNILQSIGPVLVYSNYVIMEGLNIFKIYLKYFGFSGYIDLKSGVDGFRYMEYHGNIDEKQRLLNIESFNIPDNKYGKISKIMLISPAGSEGISLFNIRQVHIMEPYWHETRIIQMIGRAIRMCSHKNLPFNERHVDVYRYKSIRKNNKWTSDQQLENIAKSKNDLIQSFLDAIHEVAIDCVLNKSHNSLIRDYKCFQFEESSLFDQQIGPAFKEDIVDDLRIDNGSNSINASTIKIKVIKISAVIKLSNDSNNTKYSKEHSYWFNPNTTIVYDYDLFYVIGKVAVDDDGFPIKLNSLIYIIDKLVPIPLIEE